MSSKQVEGSELSVARKDAGRPSSGSQLSTLNSQLSSSPNQRAWRRFRRNRPAVLSARVLAVIVLLVIACPIGLKVASLTGPKGAAFSQNYQPEKLSDDQFQPPSARHWFGTDVHARDL